MDIFIGKVGGGERGRRCDASLFEQGAIFFARGAQVAGIAGVWTVHSSLWNPAGEIDGSSVGPQAAGRGGSTAGSTSFSWRPGWPEIVRKLGYIKSSKFFRA